MAQNLKDFLTSNHSYYQRYRSDWSLTYNAYIGGVEWRKGQYLKAYKIDFQTPSETITTFNEAEDGSINGKRRSSVYYSSSLANAEAGVNAHEGTFYNEKLNNTPLYPYVRLYVSEYNSILFNKVPQREVCDENSPSYDLIHNFMKDVDGEGNSINEFWSQVDTLTTVFGVCWVSVIKMADSDIPQFRVHTPLDVNNWEYGYRKDGKLELRKLSIIESDDEYATVYRVYTPTTIETIWIPKDENDFNMDLEGVVSEDGIYKYVEPNELGYIPVRPVYQSMKVYNGVGHTPMFDIAQIQRAIYGYSAEIYSAITYGAHPVNIVDEQTMELNGGNVGAEPGTTITVPAGGALSGGTSYTFEFKAPPLESITEIRDLTDQMIEKMNTVAMIRSEDLIKASRSGAQIEQYDSKLEAFIRKKAIALENAEYQCWLIWHDWLNISPYEDFAINYNKDYGVKSIENRITIVKGLMELVDSYKARFPVVAATMTQPTMPMAQEGYHIMLNVATGEQREVPNDSPEHEQLMAEGWTHPEDMEEESYPETPAMENQEDIDEMEEALKSQLKALVMTSYSENSQ